MLKKDELENPRSCLNKAADDEPLFVLRANDPCAPQAVEHWASLAEKNGGTRPEKLQEAYRAADAMREWYARKYPE